ncbi:GPP34 family phosphoprotein [Micromonospora sp. NBC_00362]|uniref:GOLPH3/VPS74 family protein n=1 Tax=unclassified Micromonospora TaxID=2617518 RepID=UPI0022599EC0|nr:GPP34 family phosphoprotein [Micromonospora sp. NBC_00362]MCX5115569.1 GPP34 family phosphoprotein [Micromonospora sp. NBC_00362]WTI06102.1 GPP34 family phosphoprotein [Micromonospora sp. NBC_00821]
MTIEARSDAPTVVEDLLLLLFQPRSGTIAGENTLFYVLGGAVLADLALGDHLTTADRGRLRSVAGHPPTDGLLGPAWDYLAEKPRGVQTALAAIGPALRQPVLERLIARGDIDQEPRKVLGLFRTTALREGRTERRARLLADVRRVLVDGAEPQARVAALAALLSASGTLPQFDREIPWTSPVISRAKELERGNWGADAAAAAVTRTVTATVVNSAIAAITVLPRS